jgi:integrase
VKRQLITADDLEKLCTTAFETKTDENGEKVPLTKNAQQFVDFIRFMAYSGARRNEALRMRWDDVDFTNEQLTIGAAGDTKNSKPRTVDFNSKLRAQLLDMQKRLHGVSDFLFPSPQRGDKDASSKSFQGSLVLVRERAKLPHFTFHDCRHHFISMAVMSRVDYMTIASWVGHQDGGVLIGKVYGHLANEHKKAMAEKLTFGPVVPEKPKARKAKR